MENNIYQAPEADLQREQAVSNEFYVVSRSKFLILSITTFGMYEIYWFYKNWSLYRLASGIRMLPVMRAIFSIFFVNSLFRRINDRVEESGYIYQWSPGLMAVIFIVLSIMSGVVGMISAISVEYAVLDAVSTLFFPLTVWILYRAQSAINIACDDPQGERNAQLTPANFVWIAIGLLFWALVGLGFYDAFVGLHTIPIE